MRFSTLVLALAVVLIPLTTHGQNIERKKIDVEVINKVLQDKKNKLKEIAKDAVADELGKSLKLPSHGYQAILKSVAEDIWGYTGEELSNHAIANIVVLSLAISRENQLDSVAARTLLGLSANPPNLDDSTVIQNAAAAEVLYSIEHGPELFQKLEMVTEALPISKDQIKRFEENLTWLKNKWQDNISIDSGGTTQDKSKFQYVYEAIAEQLGISASNLNNCLKVNSLVGSAIAKLDATPAAKPSEIDAVASTESGSLIGFLYKIDVKKSYDRRQTIVDKVLIDIRDTKPLSDWWCGKHPCPPSNETDAEKNIRIFISVLESVPNYITFDDTSDKFDETAFAQDTLVTLSNQFTVFNGYIYLGIGLTYTEPYHKSKDCRDFGNYCEDNSLLYYHEKIGVKFNWPCLSIDGRYKSPFHTNVYVGGLLYQIEPHPGMDAENDLSKRWIYGVEAGYYVLEIIEANIGYQFLRRFDGDSDTIGLMYVNVSVPLDEYIKELASGN